MCHNPLEYWFLPTYTA